MIIINLIILGVLAIPVVYLMKDGYWLGAIGVIAFYCVIILGGL